MKVTLNPDGGATITISAKEAELLARESTDPDTLFTDKYSGDSGSVYGSVSFHKLIADQWKEQSGYFYHPIQGWRYL